MPNWTPYSGGQVPEDAFKAGRDDNGHIYVCRALHESDLLPGKVVPAHRTAYVSYNGNEIPKTEYEVLRGFHYYWLPTTGDEPLPRGAVSAGQSADGEVLYVGRVYHNFVEVVGKIHRTHKTCYVPYAGKEMGFEEFEILVEAVEY